LELELKTELLKETLVENRRRDSVSELKREEISSSWVVEMEAMLITL